MEVDMSREVNPVDEVDNINVEKPDEPGNPAQEFIQKLTRINEDDLKIIVDYHDKLQNLKQVFSDRFDDMWDNLLDLIGENNIFPEPFKDFMSDQISAEDIGRVLLEAANEADFWTSNQISEEEKELIIEYYISEANYSKILSSFAMSKIDQIKKQLGEINIEN